MRGNFYVIQLLDKYYYADNWSRNDQEFKVHVKGQETRMMTAVYHQEAGRELERYSGYTYEYGLLYTLRSFITIIFIGPFVYL